MSSLSKMLSVLDLFGPHSLRLDADTIAARMGLSRATVYRYVKDLCEAGLITRLPGSLYGLGPRIVELDWMMRQYDPLLIAGRELMHALSDETGLAIFTSVYYDGHIINTYIAEPKGRFDFAFGRGHPLPLFRGAQSKVLVAHQNGRRLKRLYDEQIQPHEGATLDWATFNRECRRIRKDGHCTTHDELNAGLTGIAAPIFQQGAQEILGALAAVGTSANFKLLRQETVLEMLMDTAQRIAHNLEPLAPRSAVPAPAASELAQR
ncbi:IclR family transcriptional regulator [Pseudomonas sp. KNUC1026]|uniref:IclR family transcriptional regulator n=1 Tax=Pseudomonas sp. KNUC1026 TaxID=2893890 RepID=UPI001F399D79|nr:IclR family transcriptional regulator [Pseudomonas sp. KNUC1026]UFH51245.1 IclR family transcriptional regulator [Pseudomonas sp. KNUC1026]